MNIAEQAKELFLSRLSEQTRYIYKQNIDTGKFYVVDSNVGTVAAGLTLDEAKAEICLRLYRLNSYSPMEHSKA